MIYIKKAEEIDAIRESCRIVAETLNLVKKFVKVGITTGELDKIAEDHILSRGGTPAFKGYRQVGTPPFPGTLCLSLNDAVVHGIPGDKQVQSGDLVSIDCGVKKNGYFGDGALSVLVGEDTQKQRLMDVTEKSLYLGIQQAVVGNRVHDISHAVQEYVEANGFSVVRALCGHGVGKYLHEDPSIPNYGVKGTGKKLQNGMTLAIEPMVNMGRYDVYEMRDGWTIRTVDGQPSAHFEHTILINGQEPEILTVE
ncbi:MAG: type I methionyl aminopeptidase [Ignavibacteriales bacterium]|nr:MAG: type I methionyl aminopeptidase [Ignavibacteriaceae bacterium]MBW7873078.1 type I methionyl aminopeptidase [Ignavibacteria bacterium]MCZ2142721.1 type I methionyl aminopeptidase [Ignavibacteriales bacterium]OQY77157.1 MAG: type I methionyl aminopeptidase [Ignavibacteriales bacterium UTCHB3]MBV6443817.1 Methionine aminopeptidase 1 [Ignavibacteriaceae bacterium]